MYRAALAETSPPIGGDEALAVAISEVAGRLRECGRSRDAVDWYRRALRSAPASAELYTSLGAAWMDVGNNREARAALQRAVQLDPGLWMAHCNLATLLHKGGDLREALQAYRRASVLNPGFIYPLVQALCLARELISWDHWEADLQALRGLAPQPGNTAPQLDLLFLPLTALQLRNHAEAYAAECLARTDITPPIRVPHPVRGRRIRIGYVSDELRGHAVGSLVAEVFELHDPRRFDVRVYCWGRDDGSVTERRVRAAVPAMVDIGSLTNRQAAERIAADGIDILVDLKGYTERPRTEIFAYRPAPVQVNWLGFPGTLGAAYFDYVIADEFIVPPGAEQGYTESVLRLADTYQPNDRRRPIATPKSRAAYGLPADATVYCYLGKASKITPETFDDWMKILMAVPESVLWMLVERPETRSALVEAARQRGIAAKRLVFCGGLPFTEHIARFKVADIALETSPYGSHTTASEALWAGCPLIALAGDTFASRVSGSLLTAAGMGELVTTDAAAYRALAVELGSDRQRCATLRSRIERTRDTCALFDTPRFVRSLEAAFESLCAEG